VGTKTNHRRSNEVVDRGEVVTKVLRSLLGEKPGAHELGGVRSVRLWVRKLGSVRGLVVTSG
jgi:hypothetical protein